MGFPKIGPLDFEDFLLIIATTSWLSTLKIIHLFFKCIPQMCTEMTTGNNSKNVISARIPLSAHSFGQQP
jgi:hypothetical protein